MRTQSPICLHRIVRIRSGRQQNVQAGHRRPFPSASGHCRTAAGLLVEQPRNPALQPPCAPKHVKLLESEGLPGGPNDAHDGAICEQFGKVSPGTDWNARRCQQTGRQTAQPVVAKLCGQRVEAWPFGGAQNIQVGLGHVQVILGIPMKQME